MRLWTGLALGAMVMGSLLGGCVGPPHSTVEEGRKIRAEAQALSARVESLEDRMLSNQANVHLWQEMGRRHENVQQVACTNQGTHYAAMVEHLQRLEEKSRLLRRHRNESVENPFVARAKGIKR